MKNFINNIYLNFRWEILIIFLILSFIFSLILSHYYYRRDISHILQERLPLSKGQPAAYSWQLTERQINSNIINEWLTSVGIEHLFFLKNTPKYLCLKNRNKFYDQLLNSTVPEKLLDENAGKIIFSLKTDSTEDVFELKIGEDKCLSIKDVNHFSLNFKRVTIGGESDGGIFLDAKNTKAYLKIGKIDILILTPLILITLLFLWSNILGIKNLLWKSLSPKSATVRVVEPSSLPDELK